MANSSFQQTLALGLALSIASITGCSSEGPGFPEVAGWDQTGETLVYDADNLWEYIDGAAELFVSFGVQSCRTADLTSGDLTVTVDLYDMGTSLNAFGVFNQEASGESIDLAEATAAMVSPPYQALLLKGSTYAKVNVFEGELTREEGTLLMKGLGDALPGSTSLPEELQLLPPSGKVGGTEAYQAMAYLGLSELRNCVFATYDGGGETTWQGFVVTPDAADSVWEALTAVWDSLDHGGTTVLFREVPYRGLVGVTRTDAGVFGVSGADDQAQLLSRLTEFVG